jgi:Mg-chelatase subunit ChlD
MDIGKCLYGEKIPGSIVHIDTFHKAGKVNFDSLLKGLRFIFEENTAAYIQTVDNSGFINTNNFKAISENKEFIKCNTHIALKIQPEKYDLIIPVIQVIEECILANDLNIKKVRDFKCMNYFAVGGILKFNLNNKLSNNKRYFINKKTVRYMDTLGSMYMKNSRNVQNNIQISKEDMKTRDIVNYLKWNTCFNKDRESGEHPGEYKRPGYYENKEWIEEICAYETIISLFKKRYWYDPDSIIENTDIIINRRYDNDYKDTIFIIDNSISMEDSIKSLKNAVIEVADKLKGKIAIVIFRGTRAHLYSRFTNNKTIIKKLVNDIKIEGITPLAHSLSAAYNYAVKTLKKDLNIILLTDGLTNTPLKTDNPLTDCIELSKLIKKKGYNLLCININENTSTSLDKITEAANGKMLYIGDLKKS